MLPRHDGRVLRAAALRASGVALGAAAAKRPGPSMAELERLGPDVHLDEPTLSDEWIRFDAPGDFQLCPPRGLPRHRRLRRGDAARLARRLEPQPAHVHPSGADREPRGARRRLPLQPQPHPDRVPRARRKSRTISRASMRLGRPRRAPRDSATRGAWPTPSSTRCRSRESGGILVAARGRFAPDPGAAARASRRSERPSGSPTTRGHVLPFVADSIAVSPPGTRVGYLGANLALEEMLARLLGRLEGDYSLWPLPVSDGLTASDAAAAAAAETIGLVVVDLGIEVTSAATLDRLEVEAGATRVRVPDPLRLVVAAFESIVHQERARIERGMHPRRFVLVNSANAYFDSFVRSNLNCSHTSAHSRVRRGDGQSRRDVTGVRAARHHVGGRADGTRRALCPPRRPEARDRRAGLVPRFPAGLVVPRPGRDLDARPPTPSSFSRPTDRRSIGTSS